MSNYLKQCVEALDLAIQEGKTREEAVLAVLRAGRLSECPEAVEAAGRVLEGAGLYVRDDSTVAPMSADDACAYGEATLRAAEDAVLGEEE